MRSWGSMVYGSWAWQCFRVESWLRAGTILGGPLGDVRCKSARGARGVYREKRGVPLVPYPRGRVGFGMEGPNSLVGDQDLRLGSGPLPGGLELENWRRGGGNVFVNARVTEPTLPKPLISGARAGTV